MREFLLELYLKHGEREFEFLYLPRRDTDEPTLFELARAKNKYIVWGIDNKDISYYKLTPKALALIRNDS